MWNDLPPRGGGGSEQEEHGMLLLINSSGSGFGGSVTKWPPKIRIRDKNIKHSEPWNSDPDPEFNTQYH